MFPFSFEVRFKSNLWAPDVHFAAIREQARLDAGWQLAGGVSILVDPDDGVTYYSQAVTRRKVK